MHRSVRQLGEKRMASKRNGNGWTSLTRCSSFALIYCEFSFQRGFFLWGRMDNSIFSTLLIVFLLDFRLNSYFSSRQIEEIVRCVNVP